MTEELQRKVMTLCIIRDGSRVLLGMKKEGLGNGWWNGFGGKVKQGESIEDAARREMIEESGVSVGKLTRVGVCEFFSPIRPFVVEMHIFTSTDFTGVPVESNEMRPEWFDIDNLPKRDMWQSDLFWWPYFLDDKPFVGRFVFDENEKVIEHDIQVVSTFQAEVQ